MGKLCIFAMAFLANVILMAANLPVHLLAHILVVALVLAVAVVVLSQQLASEILYE